jgi:hypothetical protein
MIEKEFIVSFKIKVKSKDNSLDLKSALEFAGYDINPIFGTEDERINCSIETEGEPVSIELDVEN